jgi:hypothetical protein
MTMPTLLADAPHTITSANRILAKLEGRNVALYSVSNVALNYAKYLYLGLLLLAVAAAGWFFWAQWESQKVGMHAGDAQTPLTTGAPDLHSAPVPKAVRRAETEALMRDSFPEDDLPETTPAIIVDDLGSEADMPIVLQKLHQEALQQESLDANLPQAREKEAPKSSAQTVTIVDPLGINTPRKDKSAKGKDKSSKDKPDKGKNAGNGKSSKSVAKKTQARPEKSSPPQTKSAQDRDAEVLESVLQLDTPEPKETPPRPK